MTPQGISPAGCTPLARRGQCYLWRVDLDLVVQINAHLLSASELQRAQKFVFEKDQRRYIAARAALRKLLALRLRCNAESLVLEEGPQGKPFLPEAPHCQFNVSHSGGVGLIGIQSESPLSDAKQIGLDIEIRQYAPDFESIANTILTVRERQQLSSIPPRQRSEALLFAWTRKEACVKALGVGLNIPPDSLETGFTGDCQLILKDLGSTHQINIQTLEAGNDVIASLALIS